MPYDLQRRMISVCHFVTCRSSGKMQAKTFPVIACTDNFLEPFLAGFWTFLVKSPIDFDFFPNVARYTRIYTMLNQSYAIAPLI